MVCGQFLAAAIPLNTALDDGAIRRNPCRIKGAGQEASPERSTLIISQVSNPVSRGGDLATCFTLGDVDELLV